MSKVKLLKKIKKSFFKHSPEILMGVGIAGMITTTVLAIKATPKALQLIENKKKESDTEKLESIDVIKATWKCYIPALVTMVGSATCLIGANSIKNKRYAVLATACSLSEHAFSDYKDKVIDVIGEKKEQEVHDTIARDNIKNTPVINNDVIITGNGEMLCYDNISGRYFKSDYERIRQARHIINHTILTDGCASLNDFYYELDLPNIEIGDVLGWNICRGYLDLVYSSQLTENGVPCLVVGYDTRPEYDYHN